MENSLAQIGVQRYLGAENPQSCILEVAAPIY